MADLNCDFIQSKLTDYLENELDITAHQDFDTHFNACNKCSKALKLEIDTTNSLLKLKSPELPDAFWQAFPEQVLSEYKQKKQSSGKTHSPGKFNFITQWFSMKPVFGGALALASGLLLSIGLVFHLNNSQSLTSPTGDWVKNIDNPTQLAQLVNNHKVITGKSNQYAFASQPEQINFFAQAAVYIEAISLYAGKENWAAKNQLEFIYSQLSSHLPDEQKAGLSALISSLDKANAIKRNKLDEFIKIEHGLRKTAEKYSSQQAILWDTGIIIGRLKLIALMGDYPSLKGFNQLDELKQKLSTISVPPGVIDAFNKIDSILNKESHDASDLEVILDQTTRVLLIIG
ncbi:MAG: hypothetical protein OEY52_09780 [Gammaproteobacteria bacterium]|nr:hypothetical protein [Gammaproteobacteria bacterium]